MNKLILALMVSLFLSSMVWAQTPQPPPAVSRVRTGYGYVFGGVSGDADGAGVSAGGGAEGLVYRGLSVGVDAAYLSSGNNRRWGVAGLNVGYHFVNGDGAQKIVPFVNGGPMAIGRFDGGAGFGVTFGGGVNYWIKERMGLRFEGRAHRILNSDHQGFGSFRVGLTFR
jgi:hypothetical protein